MAFDDNSLFPFTPSALRSKSSWSTTITPTAGGAEIRNSIWADARRRYVLKLTNMTLANWLTLNKHFNGRRGRLRGFPLLDLARSTVLVEPFGTGDGSRTAFQLSAQQGDSTNAYNREIYKPKSGTILIYDNAVLKTETTHYTIDYTTGIVTFVSAPTAGHVLTWSGTYYVPVRYDIDALDPSLIVWNSSNQIVAGPDVPMIEIRDYLTTSTPLPAIPVITSSQGSVILASTKTSGATGYDIYRRLSTDTLFSYLASTSVSSGDVLAYTDSSGVIGSTYSYKVKATNAAGASAFSNEVSELVILSPVNPSTLSDVLAWQKGSALTGSDGAAIASWLASSPATNNATQGTGANQPVKKTNILNGESIARFDGTNDFLTFGTGISTIRTVYIVIKHATGSQDFAVMLGHTTNFDFAGGTSKSLFDPANSNTNLRSGTCFVNGYQDAVGPTNLLKPTTFQLVSLVTTGNITAEMITNDRSAIGRYWNGDYAEVLLCSTAHSDSLRQGVELYFKNKYNLTATAVLRSEAIFIGDSQTANDYGTHVVNALAGNPTSVTAITDDSWYRINHATSGYTLVDMLNNYQATVISERNANRTKQVAVIWGGTNDIAFGGINGSTCLARLLALVDPIRAAGYPVVVVNCLPRQDAGISGSYNTIRLNYNSQIASNAAGHGYTVADIAAVVNLQDPTNTTYYQADKVHINGGGQNEAGPVVATAILAAS